VLGSRPAHPLRARVRLAGAALHRWAAVGRPAHPAERLVRVLVTSSAPVVAPGNDLGQKDGQMIPSFEEASVVRRTGPGSFEATVPDGWQQGRGAFGGLVYGMLARAMEQVVDEPARRLRTLTGDIAGPVMPGAATLRVEMLRRGGRQNNLQATLLQKGEPLAVAIGVFSAPRHRPPPPFV